MGKIFFTKLNLHSEYHQVRIASGDVIKTAFRTHHGHFVFFYHAIRLDECPIDFPPLMSKVFQFIFENLS